MFRFSQGDRVQWKERNGSVTCTGSIVAEDKMPHGTNPNPHGFWLIRVDQEHWKMACHTAREMSSQTVVRSVVFSSLRPEGQ